MFCPNCGSAGTPGGRFCGQCGRPVLDAPAPSGASTPLPGRGGGDRGGMPPSTYIVLVALGAAAIGLVMASLSGMVRGRLDAAASAASPVAPQAAAAARPVPKMLVNDTVRPPASVRPGER